MRTMRIHRISILLAMVFPFMLASYSSGKDMGVGAYRDGYGSYETMGQDPDELIKYGQDMMRYGFHEVGMPGGSSKYPGYRRDLSDETIKKLNTEQESFIRETEDLRQTIYEKELYLKAELVKRDPATDVALGFQKIISETRGKFEQKMIVHLIRMKKINMEAEKK
jgi:hypothetical protein